MGGRNTYLNQAMYPDPSDLSVATITPEVQDWMGRAVLSQCDLLDGIEDGILNNPLECDVDVAGFACEDGETDTCLTPAQLEAAKRVYEGLIIELPLEDVAGSLEGIDHVVYENQGIVEIVSTDVSRSLEALASRVVNLNRIRIRQPNLEDLFLDLTGHSLRS